MPKQQSTETSNMDSSAAVPNRFKSFFGWLFKTIFKLGIVLAFVLFIYAIYLDGKIRQTFEGQRWRIPVQVYGEVISFHASQKIKLDVLKQTLLTAHYKHVNYVRSEGEFSLTPQTLIIYRKSFVFGEFSVDPTLISINFKQGHISRIEMDGQYVDEAKLAPFMMERLVPDNKEDRVLVSLETVPERLIDTLLLVEDRDFYFHSGISPLGILRALISNIRAGRTVQGGSTLTQQLVKNMFLTRQKTLWRKANEAVMSLLLEYRYSKDELLDAYINEVYVGQHFDNGIYGFGLGAEFYFGKKLSMLSPHQMALLIGVIKGPSYYDPWRYPERAKARRDIILNLMFSQDLLTKTEYISAINSPLSIRENRRVKQQKNPAYLQLVKNELAQHLSTYEQESGVKIFTGFSLYTQQLLSQTVASQLPSLEKNYDTDELQTAMLVSDINTGMVKAIVGDRRQGYAGFNRAIHAYRPIGSLIKPIIYLAALERFEQYNLATVLEDKPITLKSSSGKAWSPKNYDGKYREQVNLIDALSKSLNIPTVNLGMQLGLDRVIDAVYLLDYPKEVVARPSILLGSLSMSPLEVNQLYLTLAAQGHYKKSHVISHIYSEQEDILWDFEAPNVQLISAQGAYLIDHALSQVTQTGTARSLTWRLSNKQLAGKTGTTNEQRDSWFVGYDNQNVVTTWVGRDDNKATPLTGSSGALILFADFMKNLGVIDKATKPAYGVSSVAFNKVTGKPTFDDCDNSLLLPAVISGLPLKETCDENNAIAEVDAKEKISTKEEKPNKVKSWFKRLFGFD